MAGTPEVEAFIAALDEPEHAMFVELRLLALAAHDGVSEHIADNAPSFCVAGADRMTLDVASGGGVRVVLHRGGESQSGDGFAFDDGDELAVWSAVDRGVMTFATLADIKAREVEIGDLLARWLDATT